jgi:Ca2+-binding RTX toxin-like protein
VLSVTGSAAHLLQAGVGNETLNASGSTGNDVILAGMGATTVNAGSGSDSFDFLKGHAGGSVDIYNYNVSDSINTIGYGGASPTTTVANGVTTIILSDNTVIRLQGFTGATTLHVG